MITTEEYVMDGGLVLWCESPESGYPDPAILIEPGEEVILVRVRESSIAIPVYAFNNFIKALKAAKVRSEEKAQLGGRGR